MSEASFIVRAFPSDISKPSLDSRELSLDEAIDSARGLAGDTGLHYRSVMVTDDHATLWAQFNMLWSARRAQAIFGGDGRA